MNTKAWISHVIAMGIVWGMTLDSSLAVAKKKTDTPPKSGKKVTSTTFGISPPMIELECPPGQRISTTVTIENPGREPANYVLEPVGVVSLGTVGLVNRPVSSLPASHLSRHLTFERSTVTIPGRSRKDVGVFIDVPTSVSGTQYSGLTVSNASSSMEVEGIQRREEYAVDVGVGMQPGIGVTIKCNIVGTLQYGYELTSIKILPPKGNQLVQAEAKLRNTGNGELQLYPMLILLGSGGQVIARFSAAIQVKISPGEIKTVEFKPSYSKVPPGYYKAVLSEANPKYKLKPIEKSGVVVH